MAKRTTTGKSVPLVNYRKHQKPKAWNQAVIESTKGRGRQARFKPNLPHDEAYYASLYTHKNAKTIRAARSSQKSSFYCVKMGHTVGASDGVETSYLLIKVDRFGAHARPVSEHELRNVFHVKL